MPSLMAEIAEMRRMKALAEQLRKERAQRRQRFTSQPSSDLLEHYCRLNPGFERPTWLRPIADLFARAERGEPVRAVISAPPQHGKTEICKAGITRFLSRLPRKRNHYISYAATRAQRISGQMRKQMALLGIATEGSKGHWETTQGGFLHACGVDGGITGEPADGIVVIDDLIKNAKEARSAVIREAKMEDLRQSVLTRVHPGVAVLVVATRWHPKDPSGVLIAEGWENINLPAIAEEGDILGRQIGEALAPSIRPIDFLLQQKRDLTDGPFAAMYQGHPRPRGGTLFHEPTYYTALPKEGYVVGFGIDLAYSEKTSADWSICVELWRVGAADDPNAKFYVVCVDRAQVEAPAFTLTLKSRSVRRPGAKMLWRASGTEKGAATFIKQQGVPLLWCPPPGDKYICATPVAAAWNAGNVLVPSTDPEDYGVESEHDMPDFAKQARRWLPAFLECIDNFSGVGNEQDDDVDALGNGFTLLTSRKSTRDAEGSGLGLGPRPERTL